MVFWSVWGQQCGLYCLLKGVIALVIARHGARASGAGRADCGPRTPAQANCRSEGERPPAHGSLTPRTRRSQLDHAAHAARTPVTARRGQLKPIVAVGANVPSVTARSRRSRRPRQASASRAAGAGRSRLKPIVAVGANVPSVTARARRARRARRLKPFIAEGANVPPVTPVTASARRRRRVTASARRAGAGYGSAYDGQQLAHTHASAADAAGAVDAATIRPFRSTAALTAS